MRWSTPKVSDPCAHYLRKSGLVTSTEDFAYLIDFGIAQNLDDTRLTVAGSAIGSFTYMAPERFEDRPTTSAVDVYSLAAVLYEALTGQAPFTAGGVEQLIAAHMSAPPPRPSVVNPWVPAAFDDVIARGMAKEADDRYGSAGALGRAAQRALAGASSSRASVLVEAEAAGLPPGQWLYDDFDFDGWLSDCLLTGHVEKVDDEDE